MKTNTTHIVSKFKVKAIFFRGISVLNPSHDYTMHDNLHCNFPSRKRSFAIWNSRCHFRTIVYCRFHIKDKVLIADLQLILALTLTLTPIQIKKITKAKYEKRITVFRTRDR